MSFIILLSPAKSLNLINSSISFSEEKLYFEKEAKLINRTLRQFSSRDIQELMDISSKLGDDLVMHIKNWKQSFHYSAIDMFAGEVYRGFDVRSLKPDGIGRMQEKIRILSGMYGLLRPLDCIAPYRLEMKTKINIKENTNLYEFWNQKIALKLSKETNSICNLASNEYSRAVLPFWKNKKVIHPLFMEGDEKNHRTIMMYAKNARGKMARFIIENEIENLEEIKSFSMDGYRFSQNISNEKEWIFLR